MTDATWTAEVLDVLRGSTTVAEVCSHFGVDAATYEARQREVLCARHSDADARLTASALRGSARVVRDRWGVAHCYADSLEDLSFAAGVAQAQDRLWQLDFRRRLADGRLAAILGREWLRRDREHRTIGFRRIVETVEAPALSDEAAASLASYAAGVNAWMDRVAGNWPLEFDLLGYEPQAWTATDSLALMRYFWWTLTGRLSQLVAAERLRRGTSEAVQTWFLTPETVSYIVPDWPGAAGPGGVAGAISGARRDTRALEHPGGAAAADSPADMPGSNNWVAGRSRLRAGGPVLAADPHWPVSFPDMWYEQHLAGGDGTDVVGAAYPGAPGIIFGRTRGLAWGRTNNVTSVRDLYHEQIDAADAGRYRRSDGTWGRFTQVEERIDVAGGEAVVETVRLTEDGRPVVNGFIPDVADVAAGEAGDGPITLRWTGQEAIGDVQALIDLGRAHTVAAARQVFGRWRLSLWNAVLADADGHFGYQMCGAVPERTVSTRGTRPGGDAEHEWRGYRTTAQLPGVDDPACGWVASANNPPAPPQTMGGLYGTYADGDRHDRIGRALARDEPLTADQVAALQSDNLSLRAEALSGPVARLLAGGGEGIDAAAALLRDWDGRYDREARGAAVWAAFWPRLVRRVGEAVLPPFVAELNAANAGRLARHLLTGGQAPEVFEADLRSLARGAATEALEVLTRMRGADMSRWRWEETQAMVLHHPAARTAAARAVLDPAPVPCPGGGGVVNNRSAREAAEGFEVTGGPSYRLVSDLSRPAAQGCLLAGQSGQPGHRHYLDQLALWPQGQYHPLLLAAADVEAAAEACTHLEPGESAP